jgi:hypothetical protein
VDGLFRQLYATDGGKGMERSIMEDRVEMDYYRRGVLIARFVRYLRDGECSACIEKKAGWFTDGNKVYVKLPDVRMSDVVGEE